MAAPRRHTTVAMLEAEQARERALKYAVAEHEREQAAQENLRVGGLLERYRPTAIPLAQSGMRATPTPNITRTAPPTREEQAVIDGLGDENDRWLARDESGRTVATSRRIDLPIMGRELARDVATVEADDARILAEREAAIARARQARPNPARKI